MLKSSILQRMLKQNARLLSAWYEIYNNQRIGRKHFVEEENWDAVKTFTRVIDKNRARLAKLEENQRFLKRELQEAYYCEHFEKSYVPLEQEDDKFWLEGALVHNRARMASEDGFVEPGVVLETLEVK